MNSESKYTKFLPAWMKDDGSVDGQSFVGRVLLAFEKVLSGLEDDPAEDPEALDPKGVEQILDRIGDYFDPYFAPSQFVPYLAKWVAWEIQRGDDWNRDLDKPSYESDTGDIGKIDLEMDQLFPMPETQPLRTRNREMIRSIARLYRLRGTREGVEEYLKIYAGETNATVQEFHEVMKIGQTTNVGISTIVGNRPFYFQVSVNITNPGPGVIQEYDRAIRTIVEEEKPAHTQYDLINEVIGMQVGVRSSVGLDTLLGGEISLIS